MEAQVKELMTLMLTTRTVFACERFYKRPHPGRKHLVKFPRKLLPYARNAQAWKPGEPLPSPCIRRLRVSSIMPYREMECAALQTRSTVSWKTVRCRHGNTLLPASARWPSCASASSRSRPAGCARSSSTSFSASSASSLASSSFASSSFLASLPLPVPPPPPVPAASAVPCI